MNSKPESDSDVYSTAGGIVVHRQAETLSSTRIINDIAQRLDQERGVLLTSDFEYPDRYIRVFRGFCSPPLAIVARGLQLDITALNERGLVLLNAAVHMLEDTPHVSRIALEARRARFVVTKDNNSFTEALRMRQPSVFTIVRALMAGLAGPDDILGLYGSFGYDLVFQFDTMTMKHPRSSAQPDMVLYVPDDIVVFEHGQNAGHRYRYNFEYRGQSTTNLSSTPYPEENRYPAATSVNTPHFPYAERVEEAKEAFKRGDLFEVVLTMTFRKHTEELPSAIFGRLRHTNPAPYGALLNLGQGEYLVSGSPEMFVRVTGDRVETCPISGTAPRGQNALEDSERAIALLNSLKDESELTMCTDVDRNDKARVCIPGSVRVIGRRQIETYSRVIHTVDHIEGRLRPEFDAIDAFLTHMWAVTVTGAPKLWAMRFIEDHEADARTWYGGAFGYFAASGDINTGLTLRTVRIKDGLAEIRAGSTLLHDSVPKEEEAEARLKAAAFLDALEKDAPRPSTTRRDEHNTTLNNYKILLLDCEDSFVLTLGDYLQQLGAVVQVVRIPKTPEELEPFLNSFEPNLLFLSPGPGRPEDFGLHGFIQLAQERKLPIFGVCLGLQALVEYFGGKLSLLDEPMHGKMSVVHNQGGRYFSQHPSTFKAGRYHSIYVTKANLPDVFVATAWTKDEVVMQIEHRYLPIAAVQFHPESIMTSSQDYGLELLRYGLSRLRV